MLLLQLTEATAVIRFRRYKSKEITTSKTAPAAPPIIVPIGRLDVDEVGVSKLSDDREGVSKLSDDREVLSDFEQIAMSPSPWDPAHQALY